MQKKQTDVNAKLVDIQELPEEEEILEQPKEDTPPPPPPPKRRHHKWRLYKTSCQSLQKEPKVETTPPKMSDMKDTQ